MFKSMMLILSLLLSSTLLTACDKISSIIKSPAPEVKVQSTSAKESIIPTSRPLSSNLIYVQTAQGALLEQLGSRGYYTLTLYGVNPYITYYMDRPDRDSGLLSTQEFIQAWDKGGNSFQSNNPNLILTAAAINGVLNANASFYLMTCSTPQYNIQSNTLSYVVKPLPKQNFIFEKTKFGGVVLVIDAGLNPLLASP